MSYLKPGLPKPVPARDGLDAPFWAAAAQGILTLQRCNACGRWQWGPEWICHHCLSDDLAFEAVEPRGRIYSYERVWHPVHPALKDQGPYLIVLVEFPDQDGVRMIGNLLGDPEQEVIIGAPVKAVFEHHPDDDPPYTLVQWTAWNLNA
ncbi:MAG: OB-fold domain-containing protein [Gammaproteobacteria bacterium]|nr:OB-fold domain-containing protein [Gammaproteobacteria bacterium]MDE0366578.1 OB-fold domain-containing protein [Gammaproteobacteria bacterium]